MLFRSVTRYAEVDPQLFNAVVNMCVEPGRMCMSEMMALDAKGGLGRSGLAMTLPLPTDRLASSLTALGTGKTYVASICTVEEAMAMTRPPAETRRIDPSPVRGLGLSAPNMTPRLPSSLTELFGQRRASNS